MNLIKIELTKKILETEIEYEQLENFINDCKKIRNYVNSSNEIYDNKKISMFCKHKKEIIEFSNKYRNLIDIFKEEDILSDLTVGFSVYFDWDKFYGRAIKEMIKIGRNKAIEILDFLKKHGYEKIEYVKELGPIYYEKITKKYNQEGFDVEYYISDSKKYYIAQYYYDAYPVVFENPHIVLKYETGNFWGSGKQAYIKSFDFDIENLNIVDEENFISSFPFDNIKKLSRICRQLKSMQKYICAIDFNIDDTERLLKYSDLEELNKLQLDKLNKLKESTIDEYNMLIEQYCNLGYDKKVIEKSLDFFSKREH